MLERNKASVDWVQMQGGKLYKQMRVQKEKYGVHQQVLLPWELRRNSIEFSIHELVLFFNLGK